MGGKVDKMAITCEAQPQYFAGENPIYDVKVLSGDTCADYSLLCWSEERGKTDVYLSSLSKLQTSFLKHLFTNHLIDETLPHWISPFQEPWLKVFLQNRRPSSSFCCDLSFICLTTIFSDFLFLTQNQLYQ